MPKHEIIAATLGAAVGAGASFTVNYPAGKSADDYLGGTDHYLVSNSIQTLFAKNGDFTLTPGASNISVALAAGIALPLGAKVYLHVDRGERDSAEALANAGKMNELTLVKIGLGAPAAAVANGAVASQNATALNGLATGINGSLATGGVATFDVARNVVAAWTNAAILTVTGTDEYGNAIRESSASGATFTGKKAFKTITGISVSANVTGLTVGSGVVLGLPVFVADAVDVLKELVDAAVPGTGGTIAAGDNATPTATTGDVRGTYAPNSAPNATRVYELIAAVRSPGYRGLAQFAG